eukprot:m.84391 g.84391  ORF g.84391 m.84391 type:complete len:66 (-) comp12964_c0_seq2:2-199(-)
MGGQPSKRVTMTREREGNISVTRDFLEDMAEYEINGGKMHGEFISIVFAIIFRNWIVEQTIMRPK